MSEMNNQKEFKYRLKHKMTGQYVSYLAVEIYQDVDIPEKIEAIEFTDIMEEAEELCSSYKVQKFDWLPEVKILDRLELFYNKFMLEVEEVKEDKLYTFYSADFDMYFDDIRVEDYIDANMVVTLTSNNKGKPKGTNNPDVLQMFESHTNFTKHEVSEID